MRLRNVPGANEVIAKSTYVIEHPKQNEWKNIFENNNPIHIEIGMGKGKFIIEMATKNPTINYIGIEKYASVLIRAIQKVNEEKDLSNLRFMCMDAESITEVFGVGEIEKIYLNFSDPWPKARHAKRRLPSKEFLERYDKILKADGLLEFKTDNALLFEFAVEELAFTKWKIKEITNDLHADEVLSKNNILTEYEEKFSSLGNPIHKYIIFR